MWTLLGSNSASMACWGVNQFHDVEFLVEGDKTQTPARASRCILGLNSPVLASFFSHRINEGLPLSLVSVEPSTSTCFPASVRNRTLTCIFLLISFSQKLELPSGVSALSLDAFISFCCHGKVTLRSAGSVAELAVLADMLIHWVNISCSRASWLSEFSIILNGFVFFVFSSPC